MLLAEFDNPLLRPLEVVAGNRGEEVVLDLVVEATSEPVHPHAGVDVAGGHHLRCHKVLALHVHLHAVVALDEHESEHEAC